MLFRTLVVGQHYSGGQYCAGALLVAGIALFTQGDSADLPNFPLVGVSLMTAALVCDALTANLEEKWFFRIKLPCQHSEVMAYLSTFAAAGAGVVLVVSGELQPAIGYATQHWETTPMIMAFSLMGYLTVSFILMIIKAFGSTSAEVVKSLRKICQIVLSFLLFPKPVGWKHLAGGALVVCGLYWLQRAGKGLAGSKVVARGMSSAGSGGKQ
jgi:adenosine 3'-phospho 5'-phosphosulfate transporter B3